MKEGINMTKKLSYITVICIFCVALFGGSAFARDIEDFYFSNVTYTWGNANTNFIIKTNESDAILNTLESAGGYVEDDKSLDVRLRMWDSGPADIVGSKYDISANSRTSISYDHENMTNWGVRMELSLSNYTSGGYLAEGSWSPDSW